MVDRHAGLRGTVQEQELKEAGVLRQNSTVAKGKGYEAQYTLTPSLTFSEQDAGRGLAGVVALIPVLRDIAGLAGLVEQVKFKEAQTALLLSDNETTEQVAAATARRAPRTWGWVAWYWAGSAAAPGRLEQYQRGQGDRCGFSGCAQPVGGSGACAAGQAAAAAGPCRARHQRLSPRRPRCSSPSRFRNRCWS